MEDERDPTDVSRLLAGAAKTIAKARYCWLATGAVGDRPQYAADGTVAAGFRRQRMDVPIHH